MPVPDDTVTLLVNGTEITGWTNVTIDRSLDRVPSYFTLGLTDRNPTDASLLSIEPGYGCQVKIGKDIVISGWIDRVAPSFSPNSHAIRVIGRSLCEDLVDCSISPDILVGGQIFSSSLLQLATDLCTPFKIPVAAAAGANVAIAGPGGSALKFNAVLTETPWNLIERVARYVGVLVYDMPDGSLMIANAGTSVMDSGFAQGANIERASVSYAVDERYSVYYPSLMSTNFFGNNAVGGMPMAPVKDNFAGAVTRLRPLIIVSDQFQWGKPMAEMQAQWEAARRYGHSQAVHLTCDKWRDRAGTLWTPNAYAPLNLPGLKLTPPSPWIIGSVSFIKDADRGTVADIVMMPRQAFAPEPFILVPFLYDPTTGRPSGGATASGPSGRTQSNDGPGM
jgi:prophage tail gpP-like protein